MKGDIIKLDFLKKSDEVTGVEVIRLTDDIGDTYHPYFTMPLVARDSSFILVGGNRTGKWQLYALYFREQKMVQLTDGNDVDPHKSLLDAANNLAYYVDGNTIKSVDVSTLSERERLTIPSGFMVGQLSITDDGKYIAFSFSEITEYINREKTAPPSKVTHISLALRERFYLRPTSAVIRLNTEDDTYHTVWGEREWISHTNISPIDSNIILFCHETSWHLVQRMWIARVESDEVYPLVKQQRNLERVGHEFFTATGRIGAQYSFRHSPELPFYLHADLFVDVDGKNEMRYYYPYTRTNHIQLNHAENLGVGDHAHIREDQPDHNAYISLLKYNNDNYKVKVGLLCHHGSSWKGQMSHPHPFFMPNDEHVIFSSHTNGRANVYMAAADWDKTIKSN